MRLTELCLWVLRYEVAGKGYLFQVAAAARAEAYDLLRAHLADACHVVVSAEPRGTVHFEAQRRAGGA